TILVAIPCDRDPGAYARMESLRSSAAATFTRIFHLPARAIPSEGVTGREDSASGDDLVSARAVACPLLALVVGCDFTSHTHACSDSHSRIVGRSRLILSDSAHHENDAEAHFTAVHLFPCFCDAGKRIFLDHRTYAGQYAELQGVL